MILFENFKNIYTPQKTQILLNHSKSVFYKVRPVTTLMSCNPCGYAMLNPLNSDFSNMNMMVLGSGPGAARESLSGPRGSHPSEQ